MASLQAWLNGISLAEQAATAALPHIAELQQGDIENGGAALIQVAGATAAAATSDPQVQQEAAAATAIATTAFPIVMQFVALFKKKKS
jgi:hypothetical protein